MAASLLVRNILPHVYDSSKLPQFLPENLIQQILQHYRNNRGNKNDLEFHEEITQLFDGLCKQLQTIGVDTKTKIAILKKLIFYPGSFMFESITKSKNVQKLIRALDKDGIKKLSSLYRDVLIVKKHKVVSPDVTEVWLNSERIYAAQLLTKLLTFSNAQGELEWKIKNLKMLMDVAIFKHKYANVGMELANNVKEVLFRALDLKCKLENMATILYELMTYLKSIVDENLENLRAPLTEDELNLLNRTFSICTRLNGKEDKDECALVFEVLFLNMGLHLLQDKELAMSSVSELFMCYKRVFKKQESTSNDDFEWIDVVVDLFLNLLSHNSLLLRNMVGSVFPYLCKYLTPSSIHQILSVLDPNNDSNPLSHQSESDDDDDDDDDDDNEESENEKEDLESDKDDETVNDKLRMAVRAALGTNGYQTDEESIDLDDMSEGDAEKLDVALANAFRQFKPNRGKSKKQSKQDEILTHFRTRVLDLIEIYLDSEPGMLSCLEMMLPLLQLLEFTIRNEHQKPLLMRVKHCMRKLSNVKKFGSVEGVTEQSLGDLLSNLLERGTKNAMLLQDMANEISDCCVFVIKCTQMDVLGSNKKRCQPKIIEILTNAITVYFTKRDCLIPYNLFKSIFQISWEGNCAFAPLIFGFVFEKEIRPFRRNQALELLRIFYSNRRMDDTYKNFLCNIETSEKTFCTDVVKTLNNYCRCIKTEQIKEKFVYNLFNLLKVISNRAMKNTKVDWQKIGDKIREFRSHIPLSRDTKVIYNQLCKQLQVPYTVEMKAEIIKLNNHNDSDDEITKKRQKTTESKREKKEAKTRRIENMSEGFSNFSFTNLKNEEANGVQEDEENEIPNLENVHKTKLHKRRKSYTNMEESANKKLRYFFYRPPYLLRVNLEFDYLGLDFVSYNCNLSVRVV
ncbi:hypothetical protein FQA39_LY16154 [Lamprigera yunnana]|nr:hypothetical protein FQA39_LY16154 [Lamprigera yunnana]